MKWRRQLRIMWVSLAVLCVGLGVMACTSKAGVPISQAEYGEDWPFTVPEGRLDCRGAGEVIFVVEGTTYAVNGMAKGAAARRGYKDIKAVWADSPEGPFPKKDIGPILTRGLKICEVRGG